MGISFLINRKEHKVFFISDNWSDDCKSSDQHLYRHSHESGNLTFILTAKLTKDLRKVHKAKCQPHEKWNPILTEQPILFTFCK